MRAHLPLFRSKSGKCAPIMLLQPSQIFARLSKFSEFFFSKSDTSGERSLKLIAALERFGLVMLSNLASLCLASIGVSTTGMMRNFPLNFNIFGRNEMDSPLINARNCSCNFPPTGSNTLLSIHVASQGGSPCQSQSGPFRMLFGTACEQCFRHS